ncbi:MAG: hypothetical protein IKC65_02060 [Lentisphaeria bacterium]|nr:hypothetical protein [Lentisphaeria bacterium]
MTALLLSCCVLLYFSYQDLYRAGKIGSTDEREFNAVIGRYFKFDSVIVGTSMSENFKCSEFDKVTGGYSQKMTTNGGDISEISFMAHYAFQHQQIKNVLLDLLVYSYLYPEPKSAQLNKKKYENNLSAMDHLYDSVKLSVILKTVLAGKNSFAGDKFDRDKIYSWADLTPCGIRPFLLSLFETDFILKKHREEMKNYNAETVEKNICKYLLPMIQKHPDITFYLYFPPFTPLELLLSPSAHKHFRKTIMDKLLQYSNVRLYDYQSAGSIINNKYNYKDITHYSSEVSSFIIKQMKVNKFLVTRENRQEAEKRFDNILASVNQEMLWRDLQKQYDAMKNDK